MKKVLYSPQWKRLRRIGREFINGPILDTDVRGEAEAARVAVYFGDRTEKLYQLKQWLPVLEELNKIHKVVIVIRKHEVLPEIGRATSLPVAYVRTFANLMDLYFSNRYRLCLYVNNGLTNFQSISFSPMVHVHINHGESDKLCMVSNQAKAYDKVIVAGQAAVDRHQRAILDFDFSKLERIGRPQLDIKAKNPLPKVQQETIMYAPTWEGENEANNYTSLDVYGVQIVRAVLRRPNTRLIYKPHPRIENSENPKIQVENARIISLIEASNEAGGRHLVASQGDILGMFEDVDILVTDISSVGLDFLYLQPRRPILLTDRRSNVEHRNVESPVTLATPVIDRSTVAGIGAMLSESKLSEGQMDAQLAMRAHYFGDGKIGESLEKFVTVIDRYIKDREVQLQNFDIETAGAAESS